MVFNILGIQRFENRIEKNKMRAEFSNSPASFF
jgi:hypothetical protein